MREICSLPGGEVMWPAHAPRQQAARLHHGRSSAFSHTPGQLRRGRTRWEHRAADAPGWLEWTWIELSRGVLVQENPLQIDSNLCFVDDDGRPLRSPLASAARASLVFLLPWQQAVLRSLGAKPAASLADMASLPRLPRLPRMPRSSTPAPAFSFAAAA